MQEAPPPLQGWRTEFPKTCFVSSREKEVNSICVGYVIEVEWEKRMAKFIEKHWTVVLHMKWGLLR